MPVAPRSRKPSPASPLPAAQHRRATGAVRLSQIKYALWRDGSEDSEEAEKGTSKDNAKERGTALAMCMLVAAVIDNVRIVHVTAYARGARESKDATRQKMLLWPGRLCWTAQKKFWSPLLL